MNNDDPVEVALRNLERADGWPANSLWIAADAPSRNAAIRRNRRLFLAVSRNSLFPLAKPRHTATGVTTLPRASGCCCETPAWSTDDQKLHLEAEALKLAGCKCLFTG